MPFSTFVELALYGPHGFYTDPAGDRRCRPARRLPHLAGGRPVVRRRRRPLPRRRVGTAGAPRSVHRRRRRRRPGHAGPRRARRAAGLCRRAALRRRRGLGGPAGAATPPTSSRSPTCPADPFDGVVLANELLDNLPFRLAVHDGSVARGVRRRRAPTVRSPRSCRRRSIRCRTVLPATAGHGARAPLQDAAAAWVAEARRLVRRGSVVVVDYARPSTSVLAGARVAGVAAHVPRPRARQPPARRSGRPGHHRRRRPRPAAGARRRPLAGRSSCAGGASTSSSRRAGGRGRRRPRRPTSPRCGCAAARPRRRRCSTRPASAGSASCSGLPRFG